MILTTSAGAGADRGPLQVLRDVLATPAPDGAEAGEAGEILKQALAQGWVATQLGSYLLALTEPLRI